MRLYDKGKSNAHIARACGCSISTVTRTITRTLSEGRDETRATVTKLNRLAACSRVRQSLYAEGFHAGFCHGYDEGSIARHVPDRLDIRAIKQRPPHTPDTVETTGRWLDFERKKLWESR